MFRWLLIVILILIAVLLGALVLLYAHAGASPATWVAPPMEPLGTEPNVTAVIQQSAINDLVTTIFPIQGQGDLLGVPVPTPYTWRIENPHVEIAPDGPVFSAQVRLTILGTKHTLAAQARAMVRYDSSTQELYMDLHRIQARTGEKILGLPLDRLNLSPFGDRSVRILRHLPLFAPFKVKKPQQVREDVMFSIVGHRIRYEKQQVIAEFAVRFKAISEGVADTGQRAQSK